MTRKRFRTSLLLAAVLILSVAMNVPPIFLADTFPGYTWESRPQNHNATIAVTDPTLAYDDYVDTCAVFSYSSGTGKFELYSFSIPTLDVVPPLPPIESVDFHMNYYAAPNTAISPSDQFRIMYYVDGTPAAEPLVNWTYTLRKDLYVDGFDNSRTDWTRVGSSPYLGAIDYPANYAYEAMGVLLRPDNNGIYTNWTGDYTDWDDVTPDGDGTYVSAAAPNLSESSTIANASLPLPTGSIQKVMVTINASNTILSNDELNITLVIGGTEYYGHQEIFAPGQGWRDERQIESYWVENPATGNPWTWTDIDNLEVGVKSIQVGDTWDGEIRVTQMFVEVFCVDAQIGDFSFEDIDPSFNVGMVELEIYARNMGPGSNDQVVMTVYNGSTWSSIGALTPSRLDWAWSHVVGPPGSPADVTTKLDTPARINAAKVYLTKLTIDAGRHEVEPAIEEIRVDAMRLRVYSEGYLEEPTWVQWLDQPKPGGGNWTWTDISNVQLAVETRFGNGDPGCGFELYDAYLDVNLPNATVKVYPNSMIDYALGPLPPKTIRPDGDNPWSFHQQWSGNYMDWDDITPDGDITYVSTNQEYIHESSNFENPVHETWQIASVRVVAYAKYSTSGMDERLILTLVFNNRYEYTSSPTEFNLTTSYAEYSYDWGYNPHTKALWTWGDIDGLQAGVHSSAGDYAIGELRVTQLYVEIIGPRFTVDINAEDLANLYTYRIVLSYDTSALTAIGYLPSSPFGPSPMHSVIEDSITAKTGESVGMGDEFKKVFSLPDQRMIWGSETIYLDNGTGPVPQTRFADYTIDYETAEITFTRAPRFGVVVTADYEIPPRVDVTYQGGVGEEGASGNRTLGTVVFLVDGYGKSVLDLHSIRFTDPLNSRIYTNEYDGYFRNTLLSDISGPSSPDGVVDNWDLEAISLAYGNVKNNTDPEWANYMIADIGGPSEPDHPPDGVVDIWDFSYCGREYGESV